MAAIDYQRIPESTRQGLLAATYSMAQRMFRDPVVQAEYEAWKAKRNAAKTAAM